MKRNGKIMFFTTVSPTYAAIVMILSLLQYSCLSFAPPHSVQNNNNIFSSSDDLLHRSYSSPLHAVTKQQTFLLDGAELSYYIRNLASDHRNSVGDEAEQLPDVAPRSLIKSKRVAAISFVVAELDESIVLRSDEVIEKGAKIIGIEAVVGETNEEKTRKIITIDDGISLYQDSIAIIPPTSKESDADIISTAAASLLGVHSSTKRKKAVIVGGGDYAVFLAKALVALDVKTYLVTARPSWSLPSTQDIAGSSSEDLIEIIPPAVGSMSLGFSMAICEFDVLIDTLGDEMGMGRARTIVNSDGYEIGQSSLQQWKELHGCDEYISTLSRSQQYVLGNGLLFARKSVIRYQREVESQPIRSTATTSSDGDGAIPSLPPPRNFGATMQALFDKDIIYPAGANEVGHHRGKSTFVRAWSLSDLTELKTWPRAREGSGRFGFPLIDLKAPRRSHTQVKKVKNEEATTNTGTAVIESGSQTSKLIPPELMMEKTANATSTRQIKVTKSIAKNKNISSNPYLTAINSASELNRNIVEARRNCILYLTASYCQKCKRLTPQLQRMARKISSSSNSTSTEDAVLFAHVDISVRPKGKQLGKLLNVDKVPSVILFQNGERVELDGGDSSSVIERSSLVRLEEVADALENGESHVKLRDLLAIEEAIQN